MAESYLQKTIKTLATAAGTARAELDAVIEKFEGQITATASLSEEEKRICLVGLKRFRPFYTMVVVAMLSSTTPTHPTPPLQQYLIELAERETNVMEQFNMLLNPEIVNKFITTCNS